MDGIKIDRAQAAKNLSALSDGTLPGLWAEVRKRGIPTINKLVILAIILSHHELINAFKAGSTGTGRGKIVKEQFDTRKPFSNLKNNFVELGFSTTDNEDQFTYDLTSIITDVEVAALVQELIRLKLSAAGWDGTKDVLDESVAVGIHLALGMSEEDFRSWLSLNLSVAVDEDELPDAPDPKSEKISKFTFRPGHKNRNTADVTRKGSGKTPKARLIHNALQNALNSYLCGTYGDANVGTEVRTGASDTCIDAVRKVGKSFVFYEIKTSPSLKKAIREALPQLLEYNYWGDDERASELVIVTRNTPTDEGRKYLELLRAKFGLPIFHETINPTTGVLTARI